MPENGGMSCGFFEPRRDGHRRDRFAGESVDHPLTAQGPDGSLKSRPVVFERVAGAGEPKDKKGEGPLPLIGNMEPVDNGSFTIEAVGDNWIEAVIGFFPFTENRIGNEIRQLNEPRSLAVDENRHLAQIPEHSPLMSNRAELVGHFLKGSLMDGFVEENQSSLRVSAFVHSAK